MQLGQLFEGEERQTRWSLFLGMTIWFLHLNTLNALTSVSCRWGWFDLTIAGISGLKIVELIITLIAIVLMLVVIYVPARNWLRFQSDKPTDNPRMLQETEQDRRPLLAFIAMLLNSLFLIYVIAFFVPMLALNACGQA
ncbi:MAG TPA: hypothetical protein VFD70_22230 [Anaerolineae bacterium]|nr:hypothetical protein [Anaerolineae bacterium]